MPAVELPSDRHARMVAPLPAANSDLLFRLLVFAPTAVTTV
jgi:hypothetical protein